MTTPEPRVRVERTHMREWFTWRCPCSRADLVMGYLDATAAAHRHAATCPALRLARKERQWSEFVRELKALRDGLDAAAGCDQRSEMLRTNTRYGSYLGGLINARIGVVRDLTALIDRAGGTGC